MLTAADVWESFEYCLNDGYLYRTTGRYKGNKAGTIKKPYGYITVWFQGRKHYAHRLIWLWLTGSNPGECIDHVNRNPSDNRFHNLRDVTLTENQYNRGEVGVSKLKNNTYRAYIMVKGVFKHIGIFKTREEALYARRNYEIETVCT